MGAASVPVSPPAARRPRTPVFEKIESGDRVVSVHWTLNLGPVAAYALYRSEESSELDDLRWFGDGPDPRIVASVDDPLVRVHGRAVSTAGIDDIAEALGVYRLDEFDAARSPTDQSALNYQLPTSVLSPGALGPLRAIDDGRPVVVVYRTSTGEIVALRRTGVAPPIDDGPLFAGRDYYYRLVAVDHHGLPSKPSNMLTARAVDQRPPEPPEWLEAGWIADSGPPPYVQLRWEREEAGGRCIVQRRSEREATWSAVGDWLPAPEETFASPVGPRWRFALEDTTARTDLSYGYRVRVESGSKNVSRVYNETLVEKRA